VRLSAAPAEQVKVDVNYQLELNQLIALIDAKVLLEQRKEEEPGNKAEYFSAFIRLYAPILADKVIANLDGQSIELKCLDTSYKENKRDGTLHCTFHFVGMTKPAMQEKHVFTVDEDAYEREAGRVLLSLNADPALTVLARDEPSAELKSRSPAELKIGDEERMRHGSLTFTMPQTINAKQPESPEKSPMPAEAKDASSDSLLDLLFKKDELFVICLLFAAAWGAVHALSPGHGKTLVAAYLAGERGTLFHALLLGLTTTLAHTGGVIAIAVVIWFYPNAMTGAQLALRYVGAFVVVGMGFWMLYRRLTGQADHVHIGGGHHHHHHGHGGTHHYHDEHGHAQPIVSQDVRWWNLIVLGLAGGIVPCPSAIIVLVAAVNNGAMTRALPLVLAFSAGLAGVLVAIGMLVVASKRFAGSHFGASRLFQLLPLLSAMLVTAIGLWLCYDAVHSSIAPASSKQ
jgi:ABC-type nickel/cobalt efflux system permease component RcnA